MVDLDEVRLSLSPQYRQQIQYGDMLTALTYLQTHAGADVLLISDTDLLSDRPQHVHGGTLMVINMGQQIQGYAFDVIYIDSIYPIQAYQFFIFYTAHLKAPYKWAPFSQTHATW